MRQRLTDITIRQLPHPESGSVKYWDTVTRGFGVRVTKQRKSFFVMYGEKRQLHTIGAYPDTSLREARNEAKRYLVLKPQQNRSVRLTDTLTAYLAACRLKNRPATVKAYENLLSRLPDKPLSEVSKRDIDTSNAHQVMAWRVFFNWCIKNDLVEKNPFTGLAVSYGQRDRVLSASELKAVWHHEDPPFSNIVKALILTGARREEVLHFLPVDEGFYLPAEKSKNHRAHTLPSTPMLRELLPLPYFNGWGKSKARMDKATGVSEYKLHDLRRTFATIHAQIGTPIHVVEALLNHKSGTVSGVAAVYIKHNFLSEAKLALTQYEQHIQAIVA
ncbi:tyrosine-type recombinase/integrase [Sulfitobacter sp. M22298]|uniref:tyrosine-type recombinase/integrase n=1 Tax=Sulfitobacter sp. M22298 TaxID=3368575 RepID=UPI003745D24E